MKDQRKELFIMEDNVYVNEEDLLEAKLTKYLQAGQEFLF